MSIKKHSPSQSLAENQKDYSEKSFWHKVKNTTKEAGQKTINHSLVLYYTLQSDQTPGWCKGVILGTLGYFISLIDAIPDLTPVIGYSDDFVLIAAAIATLAKHITPEIKQKADDKTKELFSNSSPSDDQ